jgi:hypothetical protein
MSLWQSESGLPLGGEAMAPILSFIKALDNGALDDDATKRMGDAFDAACAMLGKISKSECEAVAIRIVELAMTGERDPTRLRNAGISTLKSRPARHY